MRVVVPDVRESLFDVLLAGVEEELVRKIEVLAASDGVQRRFVQADQALAVLQELVDRVVAEEHLVVEDGGPVPDVAGRVDGEMPLPFGDPHGDGAIGVAHLEVAGNGGREKRIDARLDAADDDLVQRLRIRKVAHFPTPSSCDGDGSGSLRRPFP